ncbi:lantibiotic dehydratase [Streptomyces pratensis]|uniref:lantibiotic dehydratase n=1 Tax=Streptomyces pratensis TaxID=1169025 RepID=UPI0019325FEB|nr:lantibiotic dehydratase [Streptomyces pratensis]
MTPRILFKAEDPILLRASAMAREDVEARLRAVDFSRIPEEAELGDYVLLLTADPVVREAIALSSHSLDRQIERLGSGAPLTRKELLRVAISATRYVLRISARPTPFGTLAGVTSVKVAEKAHAVMRPGGVKSVRFDAGWYESLVKEWLADPGIRRRTLVARNNLCYVRGERLVMPYTRTEMNSDQRKDAIAASREVSLKAGPVISWFHAHTRDAISYETLLEGAREAFPAAGADALEGALRRLVENEVLLTSLTPQIIDPEFIAGVAGVLGEGTEPSLRLTDAQNRLHAFEKAPVGAGSAEWRALLEATATAKGPGTSSPQVDLRLDADIALPRSVTDEIEEFATTLWRISPRKRTHAHMRAYHNAFVEKYGERGSVRLEELIHPHQGLGYPASYRNPRVSSKSLQGHPTGRSDDAGERARHLGQLCHAGLTSADKEVVLTEQDVRLLAVDSADRPPSSLELCFQLFSDSVDAIDHGRFELWASPMSGSPTAGATHGRFASMTGTTAELSSLVSGRDPDVVVAQVHFQPSVTRALNVMQVPELTSHHIGIGTFPHPRGTERIDWRDLVVSADGSRLRLVWERTGQEVQPLVPHMLNLSSQAPNLARLLHEIRYCGTEKVWQPWEWEGLGDLPFLPRVRLGRTVLSPATWFPSPALRAAAASDRTWEQELTDWSTRLGVDRAISVVSDDRAYDLDLDNALHREMLRRDVAKQNVRICELPQSGGRSYGWLQGRAAEIVVPLRSATAPPAHPPARSLEASRRPRHRPGGEWACVEMYCIPEVHEEIIAQYIPKIVADVSRGIDRWFFVRYSNPEHHLRLRLHGSPETMARDVWPILLRHMASLTDIGVIGDFRIATYEPEVERYGGPEAIDAAEQLFCLDSQTAMSQLRSLRKNLPVSRSTLVVANYGLLLDSLGPWDWPAWAAERFPRDVDGSLSRTELAEVLSILVPGQVAERLEGYAQVQQLSSAWGSAVPSDFGKFAVSRLEGAADRAFAEIPVMSAMHMQHNRLIGIDRAGEMKSLTLLGHAARALIGRRENVEKS